MAAKAATATTPIIFLIDGDPVRLGLVAGFHRPGGNLSGVTMLTLARLCRGPQRRNRIPVGAQ